MREKHRIALSPDGSGGVFSALHKHRYVINWKEKGIQYVHIFGIDNIMEIPADPLFIGYCSLKHDDICIKCVEKCCPEEKLSVVAEYANRPLLAICNEMNYRQTCKRDLDGNLVFRYGFVFDSIFDIDFLLNKCTDATIPAYCHIVKKAIPYYDSILSRTIKPINPNAYKMEYYLADVLCFTKRLDVVVIPRKEYAPVKNPAGRHIASPESAVRAITMLNKAMLKEEGIDLVNEDVDEKPVEISPLVSIRKEGLDKLKSVKIELPCCIYKNGEIEMKEGDYDMVSEQVAKLHEKRDGYSIYIVF